LRGCAALPWALELRPFRPETTDHTFYAELRTITATGVLADS
jgi:hypothetical protein